MLKKINPTWALSCSLVCWFPGVRLPKVPDGKAIRACQVHPATSLLHQHDEHVWHRPLHHNSLPAGIVGPSGPARLDRLLHCHLGCNMRQLCVGRAVQFDAPLRGDVRLCARVLWQGHARPRAGLLLPLAGGLRAILTLLQNTQAGSYTSVR